MADKQKENDIIVKDPSHDAPITAATIDTSSRSVKSNRSIAKEKTQAQIDDVMMGKKESAYL